ncbi:hypothetical protein RMSM_06599 [Rhodopirellula maiorica SM1]|uniref:Uncharacterized protein n=1 Tax=Rhodopirellula maiorica SM1 TaxID=1265738 RepID=M5RAS9_9BACT|nr:hypothetical protein [Rhodopirellula maiorica]EMI16480.1 hypothetical protein RMSM_06599 [Rhodopirellula maiorica SM1]
MMSLSQIAQWMIRIRQQEERTPALVLPERFGLRSSFYDSLGNAFVDAGIHQVRFDVLRPIGGLWQATTNRLFAYQARQINRVLARGNANGRHIHLAWTAAIARPTQNGSHLLSTFVVGIATTSDTLPSWIVPIGISESMA